MRLGVALYVGLHHNGAISVPALPAASHYFVFPATPEAITALRAQLPPDAKVGGGSTANFTELNRNRPTPGLLDALVFAANPQVHATDDLSIAETPPVLQDFRHSLKKFAPDTPYHISPLTLYGKFAPDDVRQKTDFGATWYANCLDYAQSGGVASVTLCETVGERGVMAQNGTKYPVYEMLLHRWEEHE